MEQAKTVLGACTYFIQISSKGKLRMENTKQVKIPVANINVGFFWKTQVKSGCGTGKGTK